MKINENINDRLNKNSVPISLQGRPQSIGVEGQDMNLFAFDAFEFDDSNITASPVLRMKDPWTLDVGNLSVDQITNFGDEVRIEARTAEIEQDILDIQQNLQDGYTTWFYEGVPTLLNEPAVNWTTDTEKDQHIGDQYYDTLNGNAYFFTYNEDTLVYEWILWVDSGVTTALQAAADAQDTADSKRRVFTTQPTPPYDIGDLWSRGDGNGLGVWVCNTSKITGESFAIEDWERSTDATNDEVVTDFVTNTFEPFEQATLAQLASLGDQQGFLETYMEQVNRSLENAELDNEFALSQIWVGQGQIDIRVTAIDEEITGLNESVINLQADLDSAEVTIAANTSSIGVNETGISTNNSSIIQLNTDLDSANLAIGVNSSNITTNTTDISTNSGAIVTLESDIDSANATISANTSAIGVNAADITTNSDDILTNSGNITTNSNSIITLNSDLTSANAAIAVNTTAIDTNSGDIVTNNQAIIQLDSDLDSANVLIGVAQTTADEKNRVFSVQPTVPYDLNDQWIYNDGTKTVYRKCVLAKTDQQIFDLSDWEDTVTDDYEAILAQGTAAAAETLANTAINDAADAFGLADGKAQVFTDPDTTPSVPYDIGDIWNRGYGDGDTFGVWVCITAKDDNGSFAYADWEATSDATNDDLAIIANSAATLAQNTADDKIRMFSIEPTAPYEIGDVWSRGDGNGNGVWICITDNLDTAFDVAHWEATTDATNDSLATTALNLADIKNKTYSDTPTVPYSIGDLWDRGTGVGIFICITAKDDQGVFDEVDWSLVATDDTTADAAFNLADLKNQVFNVTPTVPYDIGDLWNRGSGNGNGVWICIADKTDQEIYDIADWQQTTDATNDSRADEAYNLAVDAELLANSKNKVFNVQPVPPYIIGDLWDQGVGNGVWISTANKSSEELYDPADWDLVATDDTTADSAIDLANTKNQVFRSEPVPAYSVGDLWDRGLGNGNGIWICVAGKPDGGAYDVADWAITTDATNDDRANDAYVLAEQKNSVFNTQPVPPYVIGDLWDQGTGNGVWIATAGQPEGGTYTPTDWSLVATDDTTANSAIDLANTKNSVFSEQPIPPYEVGDLWDRGTGNGNGVWICTASQPSGGTYDLADWSVTTDATNDERADEAFLLASQKNKVFNAQPVPPYVIGDLWDQGTGNGVWISTANKLEGESYDVNDWSIVATDDTVANSALDLAETKNEVFNVQPTVPYVVGDLWNRGTGNGNGIWICTNGKTDQELYDIADWTETTDATNDIRANEAWVLADSAKTLAGLKNQVFIVQPVPAYDIGDLWDRSSTNEGVWICSTSKSEGELYNIDDWDLVATDDALAQNAYDLADIKNTVFDAEPTTPYNVGDLWNRGVGNGLGVWICTNSKTDLEVYDIADWTETTDATNDARADAAWTLADSANTLAGLKNQVFVTQPAPPYDIGDLWDRSSSGDGVWICTTAKPSGIYELSDWELVATDDTLASSAYDLADIKNSVFDITTPTVPYNVGDLWNRGEGNGLGVWICTNGKTDQEVYDISDWTNTTDATNDDLAASKSEVFFTTDPSTPSPPYFIGDVWVYSIPSVPKYETYTCTTTRETGSYTAGDWELTSTDDTLAEAADAAALAAQNAADTAQATADSKRQVFLNEEPTHPYNIGDLWIENSTGPYLTYSAVADSVSVFDAADWELVATDDTLAEAAEQLASEKSQFFITNGAVPLTPYYEGDLWDRDGEGLGLWLCFKKRETGTGDVTDWIETDERISENRQALIDIGFDEGTSTIDILADKITLGSVAGASTLDNVLIDDGTEVQILGTLAVGTKTDNDNFTVGSNGIVTCEGIVANNGTFNGELSNYYSPTDLRINIKNGTMVIEDGTTGEDITRISGNNGSSLYLKNILDDTAMELNDTAIWHRNPTGGIVQEVYFDWETYASNKGAYIMECDYIEVGLTNTDRVRVRGDLLYVDTAEMYIDGPLYRGVRSGLSNIVNQGQLYTFLEGISYIPTVTGEPVRYLECFVRVSSTMFSCLVSKDNTSGNYIFRKLDGSGNITVANSGSSTSIDQIYF